MSIESLADSLGKYFQRPSQIPNVGHLNDIDLNGETNRFTQDQKELAFNEAKTVAGSLTIKAFLQEYINRLKKKERPWSAATVNAEERRQARRRWEDGGFGGSNSAGPSTRAGKFRGGKRNPAE